MITVSAAKSIISEFVQSLESVSLRLSETAGYVIAEDVIAPIALPSFRQSSMDGYAVRSADVNRAGASLVVTGESKAGKAEAIELGAGEAVRIFTGAVVPQGATAVVMQEHVDRRNGDVIVNEYPLAEGKNIREIGYQIKAGSVAISAGTFITPSVIGYLASLGIEFVKVHRKPKVAILITGDELVLNGGQLLPGQIFESNSIALKAALANERVFVTSVEYAADTLEAVKQKLVELAADADMVISSGGISVGDYDYVEKAMQETGVETLFYKIRQKPGKPLFLGRKNEKLFFALPGNPASSLVCFFEYVIPALRKMYGRKDLFLPAFRLPLSAGYRFDGERDEFLRAYADQDQVTALVGQESFMLKSFAEANALVYLPVAQSVVEKGDLVEVHILP